MDKKHDENDVTVDKTKIPNDSTCQIFFDDRLSVLFVLVRSNGGICRGKKT